jgi:putative two-component system response regulator
MTWDIPAPAPAARPRVLSVDDEQSILRLISRLLEMKGYQVTTSNDPEAVVIGFREGAWDVVITDVNMPGMSGLELLRALRSRQPDLPIVVVTGEATVDTAIQALREGATGMLIKPFTAAELLAEVGRAVASARMRYEALQYRLLSPVLDSIALTLSSSIEARNQETAAHCRHLGMLSERMAAALSLPETDQMTIRIAGYLHDVGKIGISDAVLLKPGRLDEAEMAEMRRHSEIGAALLDVHEAMSGIARIVRHHHERWDGAGYPAGLAGHEIPLGGRIIAVADAFHAMTNDRVYRPALPVEQAWAELRLRAGTQFDPAIVEVFSRIVDEAGNLRPLPSVSAAPATPVFETSPQLSGIQERLAGLPSLAPIRSGARRTRDVVDDDLLADDRELTVERADDSARGSSGARPGSLESPERRLA